MAEPASRLLWSRWIRVSVAGQEGSASLARTDRMTSDTLPTVISCRPDQMMWPLLSSLMVTAGRAEGCNMRLY